MLLFAVLCITLGKPTSFQLPSNLHLFHLTRIGKERPPPNWSYPPRSTAHCPELSSRIWHAPSPSWMTPIAEGHTIVLPPPMDTLRARLTTVFGVPSAHDRPPPPSRHFHSRTAFQFSRHFQEPRLVCPISPSWLRHAWHRKPRMPAKVLTRWIPTGGGTP